MSSASLTHKIAKTRAGALHELPKAQLCANAILAHLEGEGAATQALAQLKQGLGNNWSHITALQFMSGRRGEFAADCAAPEEQGRLHFARLIAKSVCDEIALGAVQSPGNLLVQKLRDLSGTRMTENPSAR